MLCIRRKNTNPFFNLAAEEYVLKNIEDDCFMLWRNEPCIVVGKHQNTLAEINVDYIKENNIPVVRRLSGGGAVFHDLGNINFTFIKKDENENLINFRKFTEPILEVLKILNIEAKFEGRNDLTIDGKKFSGNAEHVWKNKVLHHGTLLFSSQIHDLSAALKVDPMKFTDKAVKSVRSRVTNISEHLENYMNVMDFYEFIINHIITTHSDIKLYEFNDNDISKINQLVESKYNTWEWNFGYSPKYNFNKKSKTAAGNIEINMDVVNGIIKEIKIYGDFFNKSEIEELENTFKDLPHSFSVLKNNLSKIKIGDYINNIQTDEFIDLLF
jgi:lipoate-protein ligase A